MSYDKECTNCEGEGEVKNLFGQLATCPMCKGAGVITTQQKKFIHPEQTLKRFKTTIPHPKIDDEKDKVVYIKYNKDGKDVSHWFTPSPEYAKEFSEKYTNKEKGDTCELLTFNEYYAKFGSYKYVRDDLNIMNSKE